MCVRISMLRSFTKSQCAWFSTVGQERGGGWGVGPGEPSQPLAMPHPIPELTLHDPPGVQSPPDPLPLGLHHRVAADNSEGCALLGRGRCKGSGLGTMSAAWWLERGVGTEHLVSLSPKRFWWLPLPPSCPCGAPEATTGKPYPLGPLQGCAQPGTPSPSDTPHQELLCLATWPFPSPRLSPASC